MMKPTPLRADHDEQPPGRKRALLATLLKLSLTVLLMAALINLAGWQALEDVVSRTKMGWLLALYGTTLLGMGVHSQRLLAVLRLVGLRLHYRRVFLASALSAFYGLILPGDLLAGVAKWANLSAATGRAALVFAAIVYNRMILVVSTLLFGALAVAGQNPATQTPIAALALLLAFAVIAVAVTVLHPQATTAVDRLTALLCRGLPVFVAKRVTSLAATLERFRAFTLGDHACIFLLGFLSFLISLVMFVCASRAVGVELPLLVLIWVNALLLIARLLPITISNLGVREGLLVVVLGAYAIEPAQALAVGLVIFTSSIVNAGIGLCYQIALLFGLAQWHNPKPEHGAGADVAASFDRGPKASLRPGKQHGAS